MTTIADNRVLNEALEEEIGQLVTEEQFALYLASDLLSARHITESQHRSNSTAAGRHEFDRVLSRLEAFDAVAHRLFEPHELLEMILLPCAGEHFNFLRINTAFKAVIERSIDIQRSMLLIPEILTITKASQPPYNCTGIWAWLVSIPSERGLFGPWTVTEYEWYLDDANASISSRFDVHFELDLDFCSRLKPLQQVEMPHPHSS